MCVERKVFGKTHIVDSFDTVNFLRTRPMQNNKIMDVVDLRNKDDS
jgi:hypothetical protein